MRNLDVSSLRSAVHIADTGSVTRAAVQLNMTQSAVSMQIKRLEELLDHKLFERAANGMTPTTGGRQLLSYARRIVETNDAAYSQLTKSAFEGEVRVGIPVDICTVTFPDALKSFKRAHPRARVSITTGLTVSLKQDYAAGRFDIILTTEEHLDPSTTSLRAEPLVWVGAPEGQVMYQRPLPIAFSMNCAFREPTLRRLEAAEIAWENSYAQNELSTIGIGLAADLCVAADLESVARARGQVLPADSGLPELPLFHTAFKSNAPNRLTGALCEEIIKAYQ